MAKTPIFAECSAELGAKIRAARAADTGSLAEDRLYPEEIDKLDLNEGAAEADAAEGAASYVRNCPCPEDTTDVGCRSPLRDQMVRQTD